MTRQALQERFIDEYLKDLNATQAAIRAGYSPKNAGKIGPRLVGNSRISQAIRERQAARASRLNVSAERVLQEYAKIAFANMLDFAAWDGRGVRVVPSKEVSEDDGAAIAEIAETPGRAAPRAKKGKRAAAKAPRGLVKLKLHPKAPALEALSRHLGLFKDLSVDAIEAFLDSLPQELAGAIRRCAASPLVIEQVTPAGAPGPGPATGPGGVPATPPVPDGPGGLCAQRPGGGDDLGRDGSGGAGSAGAAP